VSVRPPGPLRVMLLLARLTLRRWVNLFSGQAFSLFRRKRRKRASGTRTATPGKRRLGTLGLLALGVLFLFNGINISSQTVRRFALTLDRRSAAGTIELYSHTYRDVVKAEKGLKGETDAVEPWRRRWRPEQWREALAQATGVMFRGYDRRMGI